MVNQFFATGLRQVAKKLGRVAGKAVADGQQPDWLGVCTFAFLDLGSVHLFTSCGCGAIAGSRAKDPNLDNTRAHEEKGDRIASCCRRGCWVDTAWEPLHFLIMLSPKRITLRDIAHAAGVHFATVSRALQDNGLIAPETRERIRKIAAEMGYVPDPMLSALTAYRTHARPESYKATIAWITNNASPWSKSNPCKTFELYLQGARERAGALGYKLEEFWLRSQNMGAKRASDILSARGISGLIIAPQPRTKMRVRLDWQRFSAVSIGNSIAWPRLHVTTNDQFHSMLSTVRHVRAHGYRRIGLIISRTINERVDRGWTGGFLAQQQFWPQDHQLPILFSDGTPPNEVAQWIKQHRPDAIISSQWMLDVIKKLGYRVPQDIGFACFGLDSLDNPRECCGIDENAAMTGAAAVDLVIDMLHRGERDIPVVPRRLLVDGSWISGATLKTRPASPS